MFACCVCVCVRARVGGIAASGFLFGPMHACQHSNEPPGSTNAVNLTVRATIRFPRRILLQVFSSQRYIVGRPSLWVSIRFTITEFTLQVNFLVHEKPELRRQCSSWKVYQCHLKLIRWRYHWTDYWLQIRVVRTKSKFSLFDSPCSVCKGEQADRYTETIT